MMVTAWNNGKHSESGAGYGIKIRIEDRDRYFRREWHIVTIELDGSPETFDVNVDKPSFWNEECRELISINLGRWLRQRGLAPWVTGNPPSLVLEPKSGQHFKLRES